MPAMTSNHFNAFRAPDRLTNDREAYSNALLKNDVARVPQRNAAEDVAMRGNEQAINQDRQAAARKFLGDVFSGIAQSQDPIGTGRTILGNSSFQSALRDVGMDPAQFTIVDGQDTPESLQKQSADLARVFGAQGAEQYGEPYSGPGGSLLQTGPGGQINQIVARAPTPAAQQPRQLEPPVAVLGRDGKPVYVSREDSLGQTPYEKPSGGLSPRDATTARNKLTQIGQARQALQNVQQAFSNMAGGSTGPIGQYMPTEAGESFNTAVDSMRDLVTAITRTPGVGAMSDFETRLNQAKMPTRGKWFDANIQQQIDSLRQLIDGLDQGYSGLLEDGGAPLPQQGGGGSGGWTIVEVTQ